MGSGTTSQAQSADEQIRNEIIQKYLADTFLKDRDIQVAVEGGEVMLAGIVASPLVKDLAGELASSVAGVVRVQNNIELGTGRPGEETKRESVSSTDTSFAMEHGSSTVGTIARLRGLGPELGPIDSTDGSRMMDMPSAALDSNVDSGVVSIGTEEDQQKASQLKVGMQVVDREYTKIGVVKEIRGTDFLANRRRARDIYIPYYACTIQGDHVVLNILVKELSKQGWSEPRIV